jgi:hypothetical protein
MRVMEMFIWVPDGERVYWTLFSENFIDFLACIWKEVDSMKQRGKFGWRF